VPFLPSCRPRHRTRVNKYRAVRPRPSQYQPRPAPPRRTVAQAVQQHRDGDAPLFRYAQARRKPPTRFSGWGAVDQCSPPNARRSRDRPPGRSKTAGHAQDKPVDSLRVSRGGLARGCAGSAVYRHAPPTPHRLPAMSCPPYREGYLPACLCVPLAVLSRPWGRSRERPGVRRAHWVYGTPARRICGGFLLAGRT